MKAFILATILTALPSFAVAKPPSIPIEPGQWDTTVKITIPGMTDQQPMPGMPNLMEPFKSSRCVVTNEFIPNLVDQGAGTCKALKQNVTGNKVSWQLHCNNPMFGGTMEGSGQAVIKSTHMQGTMTMKIAGTEYNHIMSNTAISYSFESRRTGPCKR